MDVDWRQDGNSLEHRKKL